MKFWIFIIFTFFATCKPPQAIQTVSVPMSSKKEEKKDIDSLFIVYSLPIHVSYNKNFTELDKADSLIALIKRKKYKYLEKSAYEQLFTTKLMDIMLLAGPDGVTETLAQLRNNKNYYIDKVQSADPFAQEIQLSFLKKDSGINYFNVRRSNLPNSKKFRDWVFTYQDSEPSGNLATRILDTLINKKFIQ